MKLNLSENIRNLRKQQNMMQEQLAEALGVSIGAVSKWERGAAVPDLDYIVEMADLFGVSVDALLGYQMQSSAATDLEARIHTLQRAKEYTAAVLEAEKALVKYPNDFRIVYRCGQLYQLKGLETVDHAALNRAITLFEHSVLLLSQNTDPDISELSLRSEIATCYIALGKNEEGLQLLKQYNTEGIHNALIGLTYSRLEDHKPEEAIPYLVQSFSHCFQALVRTMCGYANVYAKMKDHQSVLDASLWMVNYLNSMKISDDVVCYLDKLLAPFYAQCACQCALLEKTEDMEAYLRKAYETAKRFDADPTYGVKGIRFCIGDVKDATAYDDIGETAMDAVTRKLRTEECADEVYMLWEELQHDDQK